MPTDIRSFFGKSSQGSESSPAKPSAKEEVCLCCFLEDARSQCLHLTEAAGFVRDEEEAYDLVRSFIPVG